MTRLNNSNDKYLALIALSVFAANIFCLLKGIRMPNYGGDEVWFATPLLYTKLQDLSPFLFDYAGPIKTIVTAPIFDIFGFNIYSVRLFTISLFLTTILAWCLYLYKKEYWIAISATLLAAAFNHDLLFFAKIDISLVTFHNAITICYFILFINILEYGSTWWRSLLFIFLTVIQINNHIRNIWITNAFLITMMIDNCIISGGLKLGVKNLKDFFFNNWWISVSWLFSVAYLFFILIYFHGSPILENIKLLDSQFSWHQRLLIATSNFIGYSVGGVVFAHAYADATWRLLVIVFGSLFLILTIIFFMTLLVHKSDDQWLKRLLLISFSILLLIFIQYIPTKTAWGPWHGNSIILFMTILFSLLAQFLFYFGKKLLIAYVMYTITVMATINLIASIQITYPEIMHKGFGLAVWNLQGLDNVRQYILDHPGKYYIADWGIGRPLALEAKYRPVDALKVILELRPLTNELVSELDSAVIIRSTEVGLTAPDYSNEVISEIDNKLKFIVMKSFYDMYGREVYQAGYIEKEK